MIYDGAKLKSSPFTQSEPVHIQVGCWLRQDFFIGAFARITTSVSPCTQHRYCVPSDQIVHIGKHYFVCKQACGLQLFVPPIGH